MRRELGGMFDDQRPLGEGQTEACKGSVATRHRVTKAHQQQETDPVEQECHWKCYGYCSALFFLYILYLSEESDQNMYSLFKCEVGWSYYITVVTYSLGNAGVMVFCGSRETTKCSSQQYNVFYNKLQSPI